MRLRDLLDPERALSILMKLAIFLILLSVFLQCVACLLQQVSPSAEFAVLCVFSLLCPLAYLIRRIRQGPFDPGVRRQSAPRPGSRCFIGPRGAGSIEWASGGQSADHLLADLRAQCGFLSGQLAVSPAVANACRENAGERSFQSGPGFSRAVRLKSRRAGAPRRRSHPFRGCGGRPARSLPESLSRQGLPPGPRSPVAARSRVAH